MQDFIQKVSQNKGKLLFGIGGAAIVGMFSYFYQQYKNENQSQQQRCQNKQQQYLQPFNLEAQIQKFKVTANLTNPTLQQVKRILEFSFEATWKQIHRIHEELKKTRRGVKKQGNLKEYFKTAGVGMIRIKQISGNLQQAIMFDIGLTTEILAPYQAELGKFIYELQMNKAYGNKELTLGEVKNAIRRQIQFLKTNGDKLVDTIVENCKDWQIEAKQYIPEVFTIYLADELAETYPESDGYDMRGAQKRFSKFLLEQTTQMKEAMQPMIARLYGELGMYESKEQFSGPNAGLDQNNQNQ